jgi:hypothetical protein
LAALSFLSVGGPLLSTEVGDGYGIFWLAVIKLSELDVVDDVADDVNKTLWLAVVRLSELDVIDDVADDVSKGAS